MIYNKMYFFSPFFQRSLLPSRSIDCFLFLLFHGALLSPSFDFLFNQVTPLFSLSLSLSITSLFVITEPPVCF